MGMIERFFETIDKAGITPYEIEKKYGVKSAQSKISQMRDGKTTGGKDKSLPSDILSAICENRNDINSDYILTGRGEPLKKQEESSVENNSIKTESSIQVIPPFEYDYTVIDFFKDYYSYLNYQEIERNLLNKQLTTLTEEETAKIAGIMKLDYEDFTKGIEIVTNSTHTGKLVPVYNAKAAAGNANVDMYGSRTGWINVGDLLKDSEASLYVYGNSMIPGYPPGSLIGIRPLNESFIEPGSVYVVQTESNRYIKRLYYNKDKTALICMSDNHIKHTDGPMEGDYFYPPFEIPIPAIKIIYKVTGVIKRNSVSST